MRSSTPLLLLGALAATLVVGGCSGSGSAQNSAADGGGDRAAAPAGSSASTGSTAGTAADGSASTKGDGAAPLAAAKIRTAELTVSVRGAANVARQADRAEDIALRAGGEVDSDDRYGGRAAQATVRLRVPPERLRAVLTALSKLGQERSRASSTTDVTEKVADVGARLASARDAIARLRTLYTQATKVSDVLTVEAELSRREADLEALEAQQRALSRQTALAAVTLTLETAVPSRAHHDTDRYAGFAGGLRRGWDAFLGAARGVGVAGGAALPFLAVALLLALAARAARHRWSRRRRPVPPAAQE